MSFKLHIVLNEDVNNPIAIAISNDSSTQDRWPDVCETDKVEFVVSTFDEFSRVVIFVQNREIELVPSGKISSFSGAFEHTWRYKSNEPDFENCFGYCEITLCGWSSSDELSDRQSAFLNILAKKLNADRVRAMISYLEDEMPTITHLCFGNTSVYGDITKKGFRSIDAVLQLVEGQLVQLERSLPRFKFRKRSRLVPDLITSACSPNGYVGEKSIEWLFHNLDSLEASHAGKDDAVLLNGRYFSLEKIETERLIVETDIYENRVIHGYLNDISEKLEATSRTIELEKSRIDEIASESQKSTGFVSFADTQHKYGQRYYVRMSEKCNSVRSLLRLCADFFRVHLPVRYAICESPRLTYGFRSTSHYHELYKRVLDWFQFGGLIASGSQYLYGLKSLDKLYELFCLFRIHQSIVSSGWIQKEQLASSKSSWPCETVLLKSYLFTNQRNVLLRLSYEPSIETFEIENTNIVNIHHQKSSFNWKPDFMLEFSGKTRNYVIFDAKYTTRVKAKTRYLPDVVMKYVHGIGRLDGGYSPVNAIFVLYPDNEANSEDNKYYHHHAVAHDIFSTFPALPAIGSISLTPGHSVRDNQTDLLKRYIGRLAELFGFS